MEMQNVSLRGIKVDPLAHELATSEGTSRDTKFNRKSVGFGARISLVSPREKIVEPDFGGDALTLRERTRDRLAVPLGVPLDPAILLALDS
jgi:hypothetical protein